MLRWLFRCLRSLPRFGICGSFKLLLSSRFPGNYRITPRGYPHPLLVRGGTSDPVIFYLIFCVGDYPVVTLPDVRWVIDAGANVGYFSVFAAHHYPNSKLIAIEPEPSNYAVLEANVRHYPQIIPMKAGLWSTTGLLRIDNPNADKWCFKCAAGEPSADAPGASGSDLKAVTIQSLQREFGIDTIDVLKMDIEGGEKEVFSAPDTSWLRNVKILMIELHPGCWRSFFKALEGYAYDCRQVGENIVVLLGDLADKSGMLRKVGT